MGMVSYNRTYVRQYDSLTGQPRDVMALFDTSAGDLWIGTRDSGAWRRRGDSFTSLRAPGWAGQQPSACHSGGQGRFFVVRHGGWSFAVRWDRLVNAG